MFQVHVILDQPKYWLDYVTPLGTVLASVAALLAMLVARRIARNQDALQKELANRQIDLQKEQLEEQKRQLKKDLFDRRFAVFADTGDFIGYVLRENGNICLTGTEYRQFRQAMAKAEVLFGAQVREYLEDVHKTAGDFYVSAKGLDRAAQAGDVDAIRKNSELLSRMGVELPQKLPEVFHPDLALY
jgi:hypothetical protein